MPTSKQPKPPATRMTTAEATVGALIAHGIDTLYALPGVHNDPLFDALFKASERIRTVHTRHEAGAAYMALGAALATGNPQTYAVVPGPGLLNSADEVSELSRRLQAPVLAYRRGRGVLDSRDPLSVTLPLGRELWSEADVVLAVGTRLFSGFTQWGIDRELAIIRIDADAEEPERFACPALALIGDAKPILRRLLQSLESHRRPSRRIEMEER